MWKSFQDESFERDFPRLTKERYTLNATSLSKALKKPRNALLEFLDGKSPIAQSCLGFSLLEISDIAVAGRGAHIKPIPLHVAPTRHHKTLQKHWGNFLGVKAQ